MIIFLRDLRELSGGMVAIMLMKGALGEWAVIIGISLRVCFARQSVVDLLAPLVALSGVALDYLVHNLGEEPA